MYFYIYALLAGALVYGWLAVCGVDKTLSAFFAILTGLIVGWIAWANMPTAAWNFHGNWILLALVGVVIIGVAFGTHVYLTDHYRESPVRRARSIVPLAVALVMLVPVQMATTWGLFHASTYRSLMGEVTASDFSADVSPVDIKQIRKVDQALAAALGDKRIEEIPGLGSRTDLGKLNIQIVNGCFWIKNGANQERELCLKDQLMWAAPLDHASFFKYLSNGFTPGYILVSATEMSQVFLVSAIKRKDGTWEAIQLSYLNDSGYFGGYVERHVRTNGYASAGLTDYSFEIDDNGRPHWVITRFERKVGFDGEVPTGVVVVDAQSGKIDEYSIDKAPDWIDRIQPESTTVERLNDWGAFVHGYWNSTFLFSGTDVVKTTPGMSLVHGEGGRSFWYSGLQSAGSDQASNSFVLVDTRTRKTRRYMIAGANEAAAKNQAEAHPLAKPSNLRGTHPILYNVGTEPTYFVSLKGSSGVAQLFAFVNMKNYEVVGVGRDLESTLQDYQNALVQRGRSIQIDDVAKRKLLEAIVADMVRDGEFVYLRLEGQADKEFFGPSSVSPELKWTQRGHRVKVEINEGASASVPIMRFDNLDLQIATFK